MIFTAIRFVLVEPTHPGNIGATARAMKTMGFTRLTLVNPTVFPHAEATARAAGAADVLDHVQVTASLDAAVADCHVVIGTSARRRGVMVPELTPRQCAELVAGLPDATEVACLFGRESSGLSNDEADRCNFLVRIPTNSEFSSLNIAAAVQILTYELHVSLMRERSAPTDIAQPPLAPAEEIRRFYDHLEQVLLRIGFLNPANPRYLMRRLRRLFNRTRLEQREINILRGILAAIQNRDARPDRESSESDA